MYGISFVVARCFKGDFGSHRLGFLEKGEQKCRCRMAVISSVVHALNRIGRSAGDEATDSREEWHARHYCQVCYAGSDLAYGAKWYFAFGSCTVCIWAKKM